MSKKTKLTIELIPKNCQFSNVRSMVKTKDWNKIRHLSYEAANYVCEICKETGKQQGYKHDLECHEIWEYNDSFKIQRLVGLQSLCVRCHMAKHIGRATAIGKQGEIFAHMERVNKWNHKDVVTHMAESYELQKIRSKFVYLLDLSILADKPYEVFISPDAKRVFTKKKYKKKRKARPKKS